MAEKKRYNFKQILITSIWILLGAGTVVLLVAAINKKNGKHCKAVDINISGVENNFFIDKKDVSDIIEKVSNGKLKGKPIASVDLASMENVLEKKPWIKKAELFFDNNEVLKVNVLEREPVARIFTTTGSSFYIDTAITRLPLSDKFSARLPVFTNFPTDNIVLTKEDSNLLREIRTVSEYIFKDPFWMAQIDQVDITPDKTFEMVPKIGNNIISFGTAENCQEKFSNLLTFYKQVQIKVGWNKYSVIDVKYKGQVIGVKREAGDIKKDSLKAKELMKLLVANAQKLADDSTNNIQLVQPKEDNVMPAAPVLNDELPVQDGLHPSLLKPIENKPGLTFTPTAKPPLQNIIIKKSAAVKLPASNNSNSPSHEKPNLTFKKTVVTKPVIQKEPDKKVPKTVMPAKQKNDY